MSVSVSVSVSAITMIKKITIVSTRLLSEYSNEEQKLRELSEKVLHFFLFFFFTFFFLFFFLLLTFILKGASLREERSNPVDCSGRFDLKSLTIFIDEYSNGDDDGVVDTNESYPIPFTNF